MRKTPVVLGVLSMVFGGLVVLYTSFNLVSQKWSREVMGAMQMPRTPGGPDMTVFMKRLADETEKLQPVLLTDGGGMIALSLVLIVVGLGLFRRQGWSRRAALIWAGAALAFLPVRAYLQAGIVLPRIQAVMHEMAKQMPVGGSVMDSMMSVQGTVTVVVMCAFYAPFPIVLLLLMGRPSAKNDLLT